MRTLRIVASIFALGMLFPCAIHAQNRFPPINWYGGDPTGVPCTQASAPLLQSQSTGYVYSCSPTASVYQQVAAGGGGGGLPINNPTFTGVMTGPDYIDSALTPGTSPICPNGTGGRFTTAGCTGSGGGSYPVLLTTAYTGADFGVRLNLCIAAAAAASGGTCDSRGETGALVAAENVTIGDGVHPIVWIMPYQAVTATGGHQFIYRTNSRWRGSNNLFSNPSTSGSLLQCSAPTAYNACVVEYPESAGVWSVVMDGFNIVNSGSATTNSIGLQIGTAGQGYAFAGSWADVQASRFTNIGSSGFDRAFIFASAGGCNCYNLLSNLTGYGTTVGLLIQNDSYFPYGVNSDTIEFGRFGGAVGIIDTGSNELQINHPDLEGNTPIAGGALIYVNPDNGSGTGYAQGDTISPAGGTGAVVMVAHVYAGSPTAYIVVTRGTGYASGTTLNVATSALTGSGTGAIVDVVTSAHMVEASQGGTDFTIGYEEGGGNDYICGTGNYVHGSYSSSAGTTYSQKVLCQGAATPGGYGGPNSSFIWGSGMTPIEIGLARSGNPSQVWTRLNWGSNAQFDDNNSASSFTGINFSGGSPRSPLEHRFASAQVAQGNMGHAPVYFGPQQIAGGIYNSGQIQIWQLATPSTPTGSTTGTGGSTTWYYETVCQDFNGGSTLPSGVLTITGNATLNGTNYNNIQNACPDGAAVTKTLKCSVTTGGTSCTGGSWMQLASNAGNTPLIQDQGGSLSAFTMPTRNSTGDLIGENATAIFSYPTIIASNLTPSTSPVCPNGTNGALSTAGCTVGGGAFAGGAGTSYQDAQEIAAPANPASTYDRLYMDSTAHQLKCLTSSGGTCLPAGSGQPYGAVSATFVGGAATYPSLASANTINVAPSANVTSASCPTGAATGGIYYVNFTQPAGGGLTNTWPSCFQNFATPAVEANAVTSCTTQFTGTNFQYPVCTNSSGHGIAPWQSTPAAPGSTGTSYPFTSSADNGDHEDITSAGTFKEFLGGQDCNPVTGLCTNLTSVAGTANHVNLTNATSGSISLVAPTGALGSVNIIVPIPVNTGEHLAQVVASATSALGTSAIASGACATAVTTTAANAVTTDVVGWGFNGDPTGTTGYAPTTNGMLTIIAYPSAGNVNFKVCNNTSASITPGAITLNWYVQR